MKRVLFICTHNSARSQIAEAFLRVFHGDHYEAYSAGTHPTEVNPYAIKVMMEIGIDISLHTSKNIEHFKGESFDYIITVCDRARETCPFFPRAQNLLHKSFTDPSQVSGPPDVVLAEFRRVRDEIKTWIENTFDKEL
jgi:arsenate reductase